MNPEMYLNDSETFSSLAGCIIVDGHGIAYDAELIFNIIPILLREKARVGLAIDILKLEPDHPLVGAMWP